MGKSPAVAESTTEVATIQTGMPAGMMSDLDQYAGAGVSERQEDFLLPFLMIAQASSPQLKRQQADKFIHGLEAGDIFNTATRQFWRGAEGVQVLQAWFQKAMVEWILRDDGGGWAGTHPIDTPLLKEARWGGDRSRFLLLRNGHQLVDTSYHFVVDPVSGEPAVASMTVTSLGTSRMWQTLLKQVKVPHGGQMVVAPCFSRLYRLRTAYKKNDQGDYFIWTVSDEGWADPDSAGYQAARRFFVEAREKGVTLGRPPESGGEGSDGSSATLDHGEEVPI